MATKTHDFDVRYQGTGTTVTYSLELSDQARFSFLSQAERLIGSLHQHFITKPFDLARQLVTNAAKLQNELINNGGVAAEEATKFVDKLLARAATEYRDKSSGSGAKFTSEHVANAITIEKSLLTAVTTAKDAVVGINRAFEQVPQLRSPMADFEKQILTVAQKFSDAHEAYKNSQFPSPIKEEYFRIEAQKLKPMISKEAERLKTIYSNYSKQQDPNLTVEKIVENTFKSLATSIVKDDAALVAIGAKEKALTPDEISGRAYREVISKLDEHKDQRVSYSFQRHFPESIRDKANVLWQGIKEFGNAVQAQWKDTIEKVDNHKGSAFEKSMAADSLVGQLAVEFSKMREVAKELFGSKVKDEPKLLDAITAQAEKSVLEHCCKGNQELKNKLVGKLEAQKKEVPDAGSQPKDEPAHRINLAK